VACAGRCAATASLPRGAFAGLVSDLADPLARFLQYTLEDPHFVRAVLYRLQRGIQRRRCDRDAVDDGPAELEQQRQGGVGDHVLGLPERVDGGGLCVRGMRGSGTGVRGERGEACSDSAIAIR